MGKISFTPLSGVYDDSPLCYLLEADGFNILLDCGWNDACDVHLLEPLRKVAPTIDVVLLSHPSPRHVAALPYAVGKLGLRARVFCTLPVQKMGQLYLYDLFLARKQYEDFDLFDLDDVDKAFEGATTLKQLQHFTLSGAGQGISITPYTAGHLLGGVIWKITLPDGEEVVYAVGYNHLKDRHLNSASLGSLTRPALLITDAHAIATRQRLSPRPRREAELMAKVTSTLRQGGSVLLPIDATGRVLELILILEQHWASNQMSRYPLMVLSSVAYNAVEFAKSSLEWMSAAATKAFEQTRDNPFALKHCRVGHSREELDALPAGPKVVLASLASMDVGFARELFAEWAQFPAHHVIFTETPQVGSLGHTLLTEARQRARGRPPAKLVLPLRVSCRVPLTKQEQLQLQAQEQAQAAERQQQQLAGLPFESESEESDPWEGVEGEGDIKTEVRVKREEPDGVGKLAGWDLDGARGVGTDGRGAENGAGIGAGVGDSMDRDGSRTSPRVSWDGGAPRDVPGRVGPRVSEERESRREGGGGDGGQLAPGWKGGDTPRSQGAGDAWIEEGGGERARSDVEHAPGSLDRPRGCSVSPGGGGEVDTLGAAQGVGQATPRGRASTSSRVPACLIVVPSVREVFYDGYAPDPAAVAPMLPYRDPGQVVWSELGAGLGPLAGGGGAAAAVVGEAGTAVVTADAGGEGKVRLRYRRAGWGGAGDERMGRESGGGEGQGKGRSLSCTWVVRLVEPDQLDIVGELELDLLCVGTSMQGDARDDSAETDELAELEGPSKVVSTDHEVHVRCALSYVDLEGLADWRSMKTIVQQISPLKLVVVHGDSECTALFKEFALTSTFATVFAPKAQERAVVAAQSMSIKVALEDELLRKASFKKVGDYEVCWLEGVVKRLEADPSRPKAQVEAPQYVLSPPPDATGATRHGHKALYVGDVKLADVKESLGAAGIKAEISSGYLLCEGLVTVRKGGAHNVILEGAISDVYFKVRDVLNTHYTIL
eukprot:jgi/Mesvir1/20694/Mv14896-RA.1